MTRCSFFLLFLISALKVDGHYTNEERRKDADQLVDHYYDYLSPLTLQGIFEKKIQSLWRTYGENFHATVMDYQFGRSYGYLESSKIAPNNKHRDRHDEKRQDTQKHGVRLSGITLSLKRKVEAIAQPLFIFKIIDGFFVHTLAENQLKTYDQEMRHLQHKLFDYLKKDDTIQALTKRAEDNLKAEMAGREKLGPTVVARQITEEGWKVRQQFESCLHSSNYTLLETLIAGHENEIFEQVDKVFGAIEANAIAANPFDVEAIVDFLREFPPLMVPLIFHSQDEPLRYRLDDLFSSKFAEYFSEGAVHAINSEKCTELYHRIMEEVKVIIKEMFSDSEKSVESFEEYISKWFRAMCSGAGHADPDPQAAKADEVERKKLWKNLRIPKENNFLKRSNEISPVPAAPRKRRLTNEKNVQINSKEVTGVREYRIPPVIGDKKADRQDFVHWLKADVISAYLYASFAHAVRVNNAVAVLYNHLADKLSYGKRAYTHLRQYQLELKVCGNSKATAVMDNVFANHNDFLRVFKATPERKTSTTSLKVNPQDPANRGFFKKLISQLYARERATPLTIVKDADAWVPSKIEARKRRVERILTKIEADVEKYTTAIGTAIVRFNIMRIGHLKKNTKYLEVRLMGTKDCQRRVAVAGWKIAKRERACAEKMSQKIGDHRSASLNYQLAVFAYHYHNANEFVAYLRTIKEGLDKFGYYHELGQFADFLEDDPKFIENSARLKKLDDFLKDYEACMNVVSADIMTRPDKFYIQGPLPGSEDKK